MSSPGGVLPLGPPFGSIFGPGFGGGLGGPLAGFLNLGFEIAGASPGLAASWSVTIVAQGQALLDFGASAGQPPNPVETFEAPGWSNANFRFAFQPGDTTVLSFGTGSLTTPIEGFETQWPGTDFFGFFLSQTLGVPFTGVGQNGTENFESGWEVDASDFRFTFGGGDTSAGTFGEGVDTERFGDTFHASVVAATDIFTASSAAEDGTPIVFRAPAPVGTTDGPTYYVVHLSSTTFKVSATLGGSAVDITVDNAAVVFDVGLRAALPPSDWATFPFQIPGGFTVDTEDFEHLAGVFGPLTVDTGTSTIIAANHTFIDGQAIQFAGPGLPTSSPAIAAGITYYARDVIAGVSFKVATTPGGGAITISSAAGTAATVFGDPSLYWNETVQ